MVLSAHSHTALEAVIEILDAVSRDMSWGQLVAGSSRQRKLF